MHKPRSLQNRAQSLDLTFSLARITEAASFIPPDSPTTSIPDDETSVPTSATAPSFPSVYGPPGSHAGAVPYRSGQTYNASRAARLYDDEGVEEVNRVISNLGL